MVFENYGPSPLKSRPHPRRRMSSTESIAMSSRASEENRTHMTSSEDAPSGSFVDQVTFVASNK
jgi:hypothetical protein